MRNLLLNVERQARSQQLLFNGLSPLPGLDSPKLDFVTTLRHFCCTFSIGVFKGLDNGFASDVDDETNVDDTDRTVEDTEYDGGGTLGCDVAEADC